MGRTLWGDFLDILDVMRSFQSTDPRDRIFATLGFTNEGIQALTWIQDPSRSRTGRLFRWSLRKVHGTSLDRQLWRIPSLTPTYSKTTLEVYRSLTRYMLDRTPRLLDVLSLVQHIADPRDTLYPSWAPRFDIQKTTYQFSPRVYSAGLSWREGFGYTDQLYYLSNISENPNNLMSWISTAMYLIESWQFPSYSILKAKILLH